MNTSMSRELSYLGYFFRIDGHQENSILTLVMVLWFLIGIIYLFNGTNWCCPHVAQEYIGTSFTVSLPALSIVMKMITFVFNF